MVTIDSNRLAAFAVSLLLSGGLLACSQEKDRPTSTLAAATANGVRDVAAEAKALGHRAEQDLDEILQELEGSRETLTAIEQAKLEEWKQHLAGAKQDLSQQIAETPERREVYREQLEESLQQIKGEADDLLAKVRARIKTSAGAGS